MNAIVGTVLGLIVVLVAIAAITSFITMWAWNGVIVATFALPSLSLLQAFQLNLLAALLVKSTQSNTNK